MKPSLQHQSPEHQTLLRSMKQPRSTNQDKVQRIPTSPNMKAQTMSQLWPHDKERILRIGSRSSATTSASTLPFSTPQSVQSLTYSSTSLCNAYIYDIDEEPGPEFYVPHTLKGHEASAYLSYIVDYYDELAPYTIFLHGRPEHWHNDIAGPETKNVLVNLRYEAVSLKGYVNLRCMQTPGCPSTLFQTDPVGIDLDYEYMIQQMPKVLWELLRLDASEVPEDIGHQCCAQFALTKEKIRERPKSDYIRILHWVATTDMTDNYGIGWLVEKLWHLIFGMPAI